MKIGIYVTSRFNSYKKISAILDKALQGEQVDEIVCGDSGKPDDANRLIPRYAQDRNIPFKVFNAEWERLGKTSGVISNAHIANRSDKMIALWDGGSRGCRNFIVMAKRYNKPIVAKSVNPNTLTAADKAESDNIGRTVDKNIQPELSGDMIGGDMPDISSPVAIPPAPTSTPVTPADANQPQDGTAQDSGSQPPTGDEKTVTDKQKSETPEKPDDAKQPDAPVSTGTNVSPVNPQPNSTPTNASDAADTEVAPTNGEPTPSQPEPAQTQQ